MFANPTITAALAEQHRRDMLAQARAGQLARAARQSRPAGSRLPRLRGVLRLAGTAATAGAAVTAFILGQAGAGHAAPRRLAAPRAEHVFTRDARLVSQVFQIQRRFL
jgi:hypothetical protein